MSNASTITFKSAQVDDLNIFYREAGHPQAPTVLLLHGFAASSHMFRQLIPLLADRYHVVAPDLPGFGFSSIPDRPAFACTFDHLAQVMERFTETIGLTRYALYVFDYGAPVGFRMAMNHPDRITALISQNGNAYADGLSDGWNPIQTYWREPTATNREALRSFLQPDMMRFQYTQGVADPTQIAPETIILEQTLLDRPGVDEIQLDLLGDYQTNVRLYPRFQEYFRTHQPPTLAVWGRNDPFFLPVGAEAYRRDNPGAAVHFVDSGHFPLETHLGPVAAILRSFLARTLYPTGDPIFGNPLFGDVTEAGVPAAATEPLGAVNSAFGFTPFVSLAMADEPAALEGYQHSLIGISATGLTPTEQQVAMIVTSRANEADYSVAMHGTLAQKLGVTADIIAAAAQDTPIPDPKLAALQQLVRTLTVNSGQLPDAAVSQFLAAGFSRSDVVAAAYIVSVTLFANTIAHLSRPAIDAGFAGAGAIAH